MPLFRRDYLSGASTSKGNNYAFYLRDKFDLTSRWFVEAGLRFEHQTGSSDLGADTVDTTKIAPRVSSSFDISGDGKTIVNGSYGRFYTGIIQSFSDGFAGVPQQGDYDNFAWNGSSYVFQNSIRVGGTSFLPNPDLDPSYLDEFTVGFQRQFGRTMAAGVRFIAREWNDLIDDIRTFNPDGIGQARGAQLRRRRAVSTAASRPPSRSASPRTGTPRRATPTRAPRATTSTPRSPRSATTSTPSAAPPSTPSIGTAGVHRAATRSRTAPTSSAGRSTTGRTTSSSTPPTCGRSGRSTCRSAALSEAVSKRRYEKQRTMNVLLPGALTNFGPTATYFYNERGEDAARRACSGTSTARWN